MGHQGMVSANDTQQGDPHFWTIALNDFLYNSHHD